MLPVNLKNIIHLSAGVVFISLFFMILPSPIHAQAWQTVGNYPGGSAGFTDTLDASIYNLNNELYVIADDAATAVKVYKLSSNTWSEDGSFTNSYDAADPKGRAMTYYNSDYYAAVRHSNPKIIRPDGDLTNPLQWWATGTPHYQQIDDSAVQPNVPDTSDYIYNDYKPTIVDKFSFSDTSGLVRADYIDAWVYFRYDRPREKYNSKLKLKFYDGSHTATGSVTLDLLNENTWMWANVVLNYTYPMTLTDINNSTLELWGEAGTNGDTYNFEIASIYLLAREYSLKSYKRNGGSWSILGDDTKKCDESGSAYFNCGGYPITGFVGFNNKFYVGTGTPASATTRSQTPAVYEWDGSNWTRIAIGGIGGTPNPLGGLGTTPGGDIKGNIDLIAFGGDLLAGSHQTVLFGGHDTDFSTIYEYSGVGQSWWPYAGERTNPNWATNFPNSRTLVTVNSKLYMTDKDAVYNYNDTSTLQLLGDYRYADHPNHLNGDNRGMTGCGSYLYTHNYSASPSVRDQVWRLDTANPSPSWQQVGGNLQTDRDGIWHGVHSITSIGQTVYVLTRYLSGSTSYVAVYKYTGDEGTCAPVVYGTVRGLVFHDVDNDGTQDSGEPTFNIPNMATNVGVTLTAGVTTNTSSTGNPTYNYEFTSVPVGSYSLTFTPPSGYVYTTALPATINVTETTTYTADPVGLVQSGNYQGYVFVDRDVAGNTKCVRDTNEWNYASLAKYRLSAGRENILDLLITRGGVSQTSIRTTTNPATPSPGLNFVATNVRPGDYIITLPSTQVGGTAFPPTGYTMTTLSSTSFTLAPGETKDVPIGGCP